MIWDQKTCSRRGFGATPVVFVLVPLVSLGGFLLFSALRTTRAPDIMPVAIREQHSQENMVIDSDQDGLKDWEEQIYATNEKNPDTDADGLKDGDEITQGRDPLKRGPNDILTQQTTSSASASLSSEHTGDRPNLTRKIAEKFSQNYLTRIAQNPESKQDVDAFADEILQTALEQTPSRASFVTTKDIIVSHDATHNGMVQYLEQFNATVLNPLKPLPDTKNISDAMANIVHTENPVLSSTAADALAMYVNQYDQFLIDMKHITVPEGFVSLHIDYLNTTIKERDALKKIQNIKNDPFTSLIGFREYMETTTKFYDIRDQYHNLVQDKLTAATHP